MCGLTTYKMNKFAKIKPKSKKEEYELEDIEYLLIDAIRNLSSEIKKLRLSS